MEKERKRKISATTRLAIFTFKQLEQIEYKKELLERELLNWLSGIPESELQAYIEITDKIIEEYEKKRSKNPKLRGYIYNIQK